MKDEDKKKDVEDKFHRDLDKLVHKTFGHSSDEKKKKKDDTADEQLVKNSIEINPSLKEAKGDTVVLGWGRMNPITIGHEKLVNKIQDVARKENAQPLVYLTHSQNSKKDPLVYNDKIRLAQKAFGAVVQKSKSKTIIQVMQELQKKFKNVILVVGSDRISEFTTLLNKYNGKDYTFDSINIVSAGERDADADDVSGMSASKMREAATTADDVDAAWVDSKGKKQPSFRKGLPKKLQRDAESIWDMIRSGLELVEELEEQGLLDEAVLNFQQRRQRGITMRKFKNKIKQARARTMRKPANRERLQKRARKHAINLIRKKVAAKNGAKYSTLSPAQKSMIDRKVQKRKSLANKLSKRLLPTLRKADRARLSGRGRVNEQFELFEGVNDPAIFKAVFLAGGPGSGKSFVVGKTALTALGLKLINSDDAFEQQLAKIGLTTSPEDIYSDEGQAVRGRAKALTKAKQRMALNGRLGLVIDGTGKDYEKIVKQATELKRIGYDVAMLFVNTDLDTAQARNQARSRTLPADEVEKMWNDVQRNLGKFQKYFGANFTIVDNSDGSGDGPILDAYKKMRKFTEKNITNRFAKAWIKGVKLRRGMKLDEQFEAFLEARQDPDIKDKEGTQPAKYHAGLGKSTKDKRDAHFKRGAKMDDDNPAAYKPAPGDATAETKPSKHTKKYKQMFGEEWVCGQCNCEPCACDGAIQEASKTDEKPKKRFHELRKKDGSVKLDRRFRAFKGKPEQLKGITAESFENDEELMQMIDDIATDIFESIELEEKKNSEGLKAKAEKSGMPLSILKKVYDRGVAAWRTGHRPGTTPQQWGFARVNSFVTKSSGTWGKADADLAAKVRKEEVEQIDESLIADLVTQTGQTPAEIWTTLTLMASAAGGSMAVAIMFMSMHIDDLIHKHRDWKQWKARVTAEIAKNPERAKREAEKAKKKPSIVKKAKSLVSFFKKRIAKKDKEADINEMFEAYMAHDPWRIKKAASVTVNKKMYDHALKTLKDLIARKKKEAGNKAMRHGSGYYAAQIARGYQGVDSRTLENMLDESEIFQEGFIFEEGGAGDRGTPKVTKRYKKDTPGESVSESIDDLFEAQFKVEVDGLPTMFIDAQSAGEVKANMRKKLKKPDDVQSIERVTPAKIKKHFRLVVRGEEDATEVNEEVTQKQLNDLEKFADRLLDKFNVDVEFTRHFADRMNDDRNNPAISIPELQRFFKKIAKNKAKDIKAMGDSEAVLNDIQADLNLPVVIKFDREKEEFEVINKTIMRKKNFKTPDKVIKY